MKPTLLGQAALRVRHSITRTNLLITSGATAGAIVLALVGAIIAHQPALPPMQARSIVDGTTIAPDAMTMIPAPAASRI